MLNIICLKHGTKYGPEYVNKLKNMVERNLMISHQFICFTDDATGLNKNVNTINLPRDPKIHGWWWKPYIFKKGHFGSGDTNLFFDLDMVIINNIDKLVNYMPGEFLGLKDVSRVFKKFPPKLGSAVLRWPSNSFSEIWDEMENNIDSVKKFHGDQDWIWKCCKNKIKFFPDEWIMSYKWEIRTQQELIKQDGRQIFKEIKDPIIPAETSVLAFHGTPNPEDVMDAIIVDNWR
jgi:hypothetical protein